MKNNYTKLLPLAFSAVLFFTGCAAQQTEAYAANAASSKVISSQAAGTGSGQNGRTGTAAGTAQSGQSSSTSTAAAESISYSEAFSKRDLSGEYDAAEAVEIKLNGTSAAADSDAVQISGSDVTITAAGTYILSGTLKNGSIIVNASKEDKVQLVLYGADIHSDTFAALYVLQADKVFVTLADGSANSLTSGASFVQRDDNKVESAVFAKDDITFNGTGSLEISSPAGHGIVGKDEVTITGGVYEITAAENAIRAKDSLAIADGSFTLTAGNDGLHAENGDDESLGSVYIADGSFKIKADDDAIHATTLLQIDGGSFEISAAEGLEATYIRLNDGEVSISASDDGVNAAYKSSIYTPTVEINGGTLNITMGQGDTDGVDSNGNLIINGGTINITGQSSFDYDGTAQYNGGTIIVNGQTVDAIPNQMMGGHGGMGGRGGMYGNGGMSGDGGMYGRPDMSGNGGMYGRPDMNGSTDANGSTGMGGRGGMYGRPGMNGNTDANGNAGMGGRGNMGGSTGGSSN